MMPAAATAPPDDYIPFVPPRSGKGGGQQAHNACVRLAVILPGVVGLPFVLVGALLLGVLQLPLRCAKALCGGACDGGGDGGGDGDSDGTGAVERLLPSGTDERPTGVRATAPFRWLRVATTGRGPL